MTIIEQLKAEIERLKNNMDDRDPLAPNQKAGYLFALADVLSLLSTIESEKPTNLEEEINRYLREECSDDDEPGIHEIAEHFAQWGAEHLADTNKTWPKDLEEAARKTYPNKEGDLCSLHSVLQRAAFITGAKWQKEQMMKEAVEMEAGMFGKHLPMLIVTEPMEMKDFPAKHGQTVRVIVLPKDNSHE